MDPGEREAGQAQAPQVGVGEPPVCPPTPTTTDPGVSSPQGPKTSGPLEPKAASSRSHSWSGVGGGAHLRGHHPGHPFIQDPAMPPLPPPNTLAQLEEACRRLEEVSKPQKPR